MDILDIQSEEDLIVYLLRNPHVNNMRELGQMMYVLWKIGKAELIRIDAHDEWTRICKVTFRHEHSILYRMLSGEICILRGKQSIGFIRGTPECDEMMQLLDVTYEHT